MKVHELKIWPEHFRDVVEGTKRAEIRKNDRGFAVGDLLYLREWDPRRERHTGRSVHAQVTHVLRADEAESAGLAEGYAMLGIQRVES